MTLDDTSGYKSRHFRETIQEISLDSVILPNSRTANRFPDVPETGHGERVPDYRGPFTVTLNRTHEKGTPVRLFGETVPKSEKTIVQAREGWERQKMVRKIMRKSRAEPGKDGEKTKNGGNGPMAGKNRITSEYQPAHRRGCWGSGGRGCGWRGPRTRRRREQGCPRLRHSRVHGGGGYA